MIKSPISILQEFMVKSNKTPPTYECIGDKMVGLNNHLFTVRAISGELSAEGKGSTRKEAKNNAAKEMLLQIGRAKPTEVKINNNGTKSISNSIMEIDGPLPLSTESNLNYVGLLHEYCVQKSLNAPKFDDVDSWGPSHMMNFTIRCEVGEIKEEATATTKKNARSDAAKKVWLKISKMRFAPPINKIAEQRIQEVKDLKLDEVLTDYSEEHQVSKDNMKMTKSVSNSSMEIDDSLPLNTESKLNYIGLLHEYCVQKSLNAPKFDVVDSWGPSHMMNFTIRCEVDEIKEEATATTKKNARSDAAKKVWFKISKMRFDPPINKIIEQRIQEISIEVKDLKLDEVLPDYSEEQQVAKDKYLNLTKIKPFTFINDKETLENCHHLIASRYSDSLRESIIAELSQITKAQENINLLQIYKSIVQKVAKSLGVELHRMILRQKKSTGEFTVVYKLKTQPPIVHISSGETECLADFHTIVGIAKDCQIFLS